MTGLRRHQLRRLDAAGWRAARGGKWDAEARACIDAWADRDLPLVVTRQPGVLAPGRVALGLPAPTDFGRRRIAIDVDAATTLPHDGFPLAIDVEPFLDPASRTAWRDLAQALGPAVRVYGSHGWQWLTGFDHVREGSDIDLLVSVDDADHADAACAVLAACRGVAARLDGELLFPNGDGVAWREWAGRKSSRVGVLVKRIDGARIEEVAC